MAETSTNFPTVINNHLDSIDINADGHLVLGSSSLTGRYWFGALWFYRDPSHAPDENSCSAAVETCSGVCDVKWLTNRRVISALDSGEVQIWDLSEDLTRFQQVAAVQEHDNIVASVSIAADKNKAVSGSHDHSIKVWDLQELSRATTYNLQELNSIATYKAHWGAVSCVACHPTNTAVFLSVSQDGRTLLWDIRKPKPARQLGNESGHIPMTVTWHPEDEFSLVVGTEGGSISLHDTRMNIQQPQIHHVHSRSVHRLQYSKSNPGWLASCSEDCTVAVSQVSTDEIELMMRDTQHTDFVQGLCWDQTGRKLYSSGWDMQVYCHQVQAGLVNGHESVPPMET